MAKQPPLKPTYMKGKKPITIALHDIIKVLEEIEKSELTSKFVKAAKAKGSFVSVHADTVNFVKDFFVENEMHKRSIGQHIINARGAVAPRATAPAGGPMEAVAAATRRDRHDCHFGRR